MQILAAPVAFQPIASFAQSEPVAAYSFDGGAGTSVADSSGNGNTLSLANGANWSSGRYGGALAFDGANDAAIATAANPALNLLGYRFTLSAWVNPRSNSTWQLIVNKPFTSGHSPPYFDWSMHREMGTGKLAAWLGCESAQRASNSAIPLNTWTHVAVTYDGSNLRHYINGVLDRTTPVRCAVTNTHSRPIRIGANASNAEVMNGSIDDVRIYDRTLSQSEIQADMATPLVDTAHESDAAPPTVSISAPTNGATVSNTVSVSAAAADNVAVTGVQFKLDGVNLGAEDQSVPYSLSWDTRSVANGSHTLTALARDAAGNTTTSSGVTITVSNAATIPPPALTLTATPTTLASGASSTLSWNSSNASSCTASGAWSGSKALSGSQSTGALTNDSTFTLNCTGAGGNISASVTVDVSTPAPALTLSANPASIASGASSALAWTSSNATSCTASGAWSGSKQVNGSQSTGTLTADATYTLSCSGPAGSISRSATINVETEASHPTDALAAYSFDAGSGMIVADSTGNGNSLTLLNGTAWSSGVYGSALSFDGSNDAAVANAANSALSLLGRSFTLSAWVNPRSNSTWQLIVNKPYTSGHSPPYFDWSMHRELGTGKLAVWLGCESIQRTSNSAIPLNSWTHVAVTYDGTALRHYINGVLDRSTPVSCAITNTNSRPIRIGANGGGGEVMNGLIDDVRIYNRPLTTSEIRNDMATPLPTESAPSDTSAPTATITSPASGATVNGNVTISATATDNVGIVGVQFKIDGTNLGAEDQTAPYSIAWNSAGVANGSHTITAVARDASGNTSTPASVTVNVNNSSQTPAPTVSLSANPRTVSSGSSSTLTWSTSNASSCTASGAWSGSKALSGSQSTGALSSSRSYTLTCSGAGGSASSSATVEVTSSAPPAPSVTLSASPTTVPSGGSSNLSWSSVNASSCTASGSWSGTKPTSGSASTGALSAASNSFALVCSGTGGSASDSATVAVDGGATIHGLDFPGSAATTGSIRFRFNNPLAIYPATYIWKLKPRRQNGYYTTFFWGNDGHYSWPGAAYTADSYYGAHPYPTTGGGSTHKWEIAAYSMDYLSNETVAYDVWHTQVLRVWSDGSGKHHEFYWDWPNTSRVVRVDLPANYGNAMPPKPALTFGDAPWNPSNEILSGVLRGIQIYSSTLSLNDIAAEIASPQSTSSGISSMWYLNLNPTPSDISDKSGRGHHPEWATSERATLWTGP